MKGGKKALDKGGYICAIFMDLSKAFDTLNHKLLIAKLGAYKFDAKALYYIKSYLGYWKQRVRWIAVLVLGKKLLLEYHKVPF